MVVMCCFVLPLGMLPALISTLKIHTVIHLNKKYRNYKLFWLLYTEEHQVRKLIENKLGRIDESRMEIQVHGIH